MPHSLMGNHLELQGLSLDGCTTVHDPLAADVGLEISVRVQSLRLPFSPFLRLKIGALTRNAVIIIIVIGRSTQV